MSAARSTSSILSSPIPCHCEPRVGATRRPRTGSAKQSSPDCFVAARLAMTSRLRPHAVAAFTWLAHPLTQVDEFDGEAARVARVDNLLDPEGLGGAERRAQEVQAFLDLGDLRLGVGSGIDLGA